MRALLRRPLASSFLFAAVLGSHLDAQPCTGPDQLNSAPCCQLVSPNLPAFQGAALPALGICWNNCKPQVQNALKIDWQPPSMIQCSEYVTLLTVYDVNSGLPIMAGKLHLAYTRTWDEVDPSGSVHQVWRFAAKADLSTALVGIVPPCPTPDCLPPFGNQPTAFFYGYVDYALDCGSGVMDQALVLYHACDFFIHKPGFSDRPGTFHPMRSYAIVAPHSTAQPFVPMNQPAPAGPMIGDAVRDFVSLPGMPCMASDPILSGQVGLLGGACLCLPGPQPKHNQFRSFVGKTACPDPTGVSGNFQALNLAFPNLPWFFLTSSAIGCWTNGNAYPGKECAWVDEGLFIDQTACSGSFVSIKYGGTTKDGWMVLHPVLIRGFTDLADNYTAPLMGPYSFPIFGSIHPTDRVLYTNTP